MPSNKKLQIALEFMILFSFVLLVFTVLFAVIATQRTQTTNSQIYSQEQLIAQNIAAQLDRALQAGNGYFAMVPLTGMIGSLNYQISITKNGAVIVNATAGKQVMQAIAYSTVKNVVSNSIYSQNGLLSYYNLPIANGTIAIQNSFGTICVDYNCPSTLGQAWNVSLSTQGCHALDMNGQSSYISIPASNSLNSPSKTQKITMEATVNMHSLTSEIFEYGKFGVYGLEVGPIETESPSQPGNFIATVGTAVSGIVDCNAPFQLKTNVWYQLVATYDSSTSTMVKYVNGNPYCVKSVSATLVNSITPLTFAEQWTNDVETENDLIADTQIYNYTLSSNQIQALYQKGLCGSPINTNTLVGWWPLNSNANDYSGNSNNADTFNGPLIYRAVAQISARVTDIFGLPVANALVGFTTNLGNLSASTGAIGMEATNYTNSNGIAVAFLNQQGSNGKAFVTATAYNGNLSAQSSLIGWWPLKQNLALGQTIYDISGNGNNGILINYAPNYAASFDGSTSYIQTPYLQNSVTQYTIAAWVQTTSASGVIIQDRGSGSGSSITLAIGPTCSGSFCPGSSAGVPAVGFDTNNAWIAVNGNYPINDGKWHFITGTFSAPSGSGIYPSDFMLYIDGVNSPGPTSTTGPATSPLTGLGGTVIGYHQAWNLFFKGNVADVQIYSSALSSQQVSQLYVEGITGQPLGSNLVVWYPFNGNANDYSGYRNNGVGYGNLNYVPLPPPQTPNINNNLLVALFNGQSSYISTNFIQPIAPFSVSFWFKPTRLGNGGTDGYSTGLMSSAVGSFANSWYVEWRNSGSFELGTGDASATWHPVILGSITQLNVWYHVAINYNPVTGAAQSYLNGAAWGSGTASTWGSPATPLYIGTSTTAPFNALSYGQYFGGRIANVQIYNTSLSPAEMNRLYLAGIGGVPIHVQNLVGWWPLNGNANDYSGKVNTGVGTNVVYAQQQSLQIANTSLSGYGINFNKTNDYIAANVPLVNINAGGYNTASFWMYWNGNSNSMPFAFTDGVNIKQSLWFPSLSCFGFSTANGNAYGLNPTPLLSRWVFVTAEFYNGAYTGNSTLYINGIRQPLSQCYGSANSGTANSVVYVGGTPLNGGYYFNGTIADFRLYGGALSQQQVLNLYLSQTPPNAATNVGMSWIP